MSISDAASPARASSRSLAGASGSRAGRVRAAVRASSRAFPRLALWACVLLLGFAACGRPKPYAGVIVTERLRAPFDVAARRVLFGQSVDRFECPPPLRAVRDVTVDGFYSDKDASVVSPQALARYREATKPLADFETQITAISDAFVRSAPARPSIAGCVAEWLDAWTREGALLGRMSQQGGYERTWALSAIAASYLKLQDAEGIDAARRQRVEEWIRRLAGEMTAYYSARTGADTLNNQAYWAGQASVLAGVAVNDKGLFDWGIERYRLGISQIQEDGTLPLELARKGKARYYHSLALIPLVTIAEAATQNGIDLYGERAGIVRRLAGRTIESLDDPAFFEGLTGARQTWLGELNGAPLTWAEAYFARFGDQRLAPWLLRFRPLRNPWSGGDATLLYGAVRLPGAAESRHISVATDRRSG